MAGKTISLKGFISREFFRAALLPLLIISATLAGLYFVMNGHLLEKTLKTLSRDRLSYLMEISDSQARIIGGRLDAVTHLGRVLQAHTSRFFVQPDQFQRPDPAPEFGFAPNGIYYKLRNNGGSSVFYSGASPIGNPQKDKALRSETLDPLFKNIFGTNGNIVAVYLNTFDSMCRYYPFLENVHEQISPDMKIPEFNFYYLADMTHNPKGGPVWTGSYLDPMGKGWMMSCIAPIYNDGFLEGVAGIDITIKNFIGSLLDLDLPWGSQAFLVDAEGTIMAMPPEVERIFGIRELQDFSYRGKVRKDTGKPATFNLQKSVPVEAQGAVAALMRRGEGSVELAIDGQRYVLCQHTVSEAGWKLMVMADRTSVLRPILQMERHAGRTGKVVVGALVLFYLIFFSFLAFRTRRLAEGIAETIGGLSEVTRRLGTGVYETKIRPTAVVEIDALSDQFENMAQDLKTLHGSLEQKIDQANQAKDLARKAETELKAHQVHLERVVENRTLELTETNVRLREDITKRKQIETRLNLERRQLLSIFDSIDEPVYISAPDTYEMLYANEAMRNYLSGSMAGKCYQLLQNRKEPCPFCTNSIIFGEKLGRAHIWEHRNNHSGRWFRCIDKAIQWPDGRMVRYEMAIDITEQRNAAEERQGLRERLRRAEKMEALGTLAGGVAHDLNNVLGGIVGYPDLLLMDMAADHAMRKPIETIQRSGQKAAAIVQDLLTLARRGVAVMEATCLNDIATGYLASPEHERLLRHHPGIRIETNLAPGLHQCMGSSVHLSKTVMNLVSNAAESMPEGGRIAVATENRYIDRPLKGYEEVLAGDYTVLKVADGGIGILPEDLPHIFEPFYTKKKLGRSGTGLGMAVVWGTVKDHQGYIEIESGPGVGTTVEIYLPATGGNLCVERHQNSLEGFRGNGQSILVVDDVEIQREIATGMLQRLGYATITVPSGEDAVAYLEKKRVDLVLLDMIMDPGIDGLETYRRIIRIHPGQKAIVVSGYSETEAVREARALGAGQYVKKPYTAEEIGRAIQQTLQAK